MKLMYGFYTRRCTLLLQIMNYELGKPKELDSITKEDVLKNNLWIWTWEAGLEGDFDEDWQIPVNGIVQFWIPPDTLTLLLKFVF